MNQKFSRVRSMDFTATNENQQVHWADRATPSWASFDRNPGGRYGYAGIGSPWEHVVALANQANVDVWICISARVTDDYVTKVAQLFKYGSDGVNPYTAVQASPAYPPLNPSLHLYVEYGNEVWNSAPGFQDAHAFNRAAALNESGTGTPINFDGDGAANAAPRRVARRIVEISNLFRNVFEPSNGAAPMAQVRPILATQLGDAQGTFSQGVQMLLNYYGGLAAPNFVAGTPLPAGGFHPPSYYVYGAGGAPYYSPAAGVGLDAIWTSGTFDVNSPDWTRDLTAEAGHAAILGVRLVGYEGGPELLAASGTDASVQQMAWLDPRMRTNLVDHYRSWASYGGDQLNWLEAAGDKSWGFAGPSLFDQSTPKLLGVADIAAAARYPVTYGYALGVSRTAGEATLTSRGNGPAAAGSRVVGVNDPGLDVWAGFAFNVPQVGSRTVTLNLLSGNGTVRVYVDGVSIGARAAAAGTITLDVGPLNTGVHGVIVSAAAGSFELNTVRLD